MCVMFVLYVDTLFFCMRKTAYEMRISDWSSDVCSSDLGSRLTRSRALIRSRRIKGISARRYGLWLRPSVFPHDCATPPCTCMAPRHRVCCCMDLAASVYPILAPQCAGRHAGPIADSTQCYAHLIGGTPTLYRKSNRLNYRH